MAQATSVEPFSQFKQLYIDADDQKVLKYSNLKNLVKKFLI